MKIKGKTIEFITSEKGSQRSDFSEIDKILGDYLTPREAISSFSKVMWSATKPVPFREVQKFVSHITGWSSRTKMNREATLSLWKLTAGNHWYTPEQRMELAVCFLANGFSKIPSRELFSMLMEIEPMDREYKRLFTSHLIRSKGNQFPPWAYVAQEELQEALNEVELDQEILEKVPEEDIPEFIRKWAISDVLLKYYRPIRMPSAAKQYAVLWHCLFADDPEMEIETIFDEVGTMWQYDRDSIYLGLVDAVYELREKLAPEFVEKMFHRFLNLGNGQVRKKAYRYGYEIFGADYTQAALKDNNSAIRKWAKGFLQRGGKPSKGGRPKKARGIAQQDLF